MTPAARPRLLTGPVVRLFTADFAAMISFYLLLSVVPLCAADRGIGTAEAGLSTGVLMFTAVAAELTTPALAARLGYRRLLMGGLVLLGAPALVLPAAAAVGVAGRVGGSRHRIRHRRGDGRSDRRHRHLRSGAGRAWASSV